MRFLIYFDRINIFNTLNLYKYYLKCLLYDPALTDPFFCSERRNRPAERRSAELRGVQTW